METQPIEKTLEDGTIVKIVGEIAYTPQPDLAMTKEDIVIRIKILEKKIEANTDLPELNKLKETLTHM